MRRLVLIALTALGLAVASRAAAYHDRGREWTTNTAYTLRGGEFSLGVRDLSAGVLDEVMVGTSALLWAVGPFFGTVIPNASVKVRDWFHGDVAVSASVSVLYVDATAVLETYAPDAKVSGELLAVTSAVASSVRLGDTYGASVELMYAALGATGNSADASFEGSAVVDSLRLGALATARVTRALQLRLHGQTLLYRESPELSVRFASDPATRVDADVRVGEPPPLGAWQLVPAIALSGANVNFMFGAGYGWQSLPVAGIVLSDPGLVVDLDFFVRF